MNAIIAFILICLDDKKDKEHAHDAHGDLATEIINDKEGQPRCGGNHFTNWMCDLFFIGVRCTSPFKCTV